MLTDSKKQDTGSYHSIGKLLDELIAQHTGAVGAEDLPVIRIVDALLELGYTNRASDIHIEPYEEKTLIRLRIDGLLHDIVEIPPALHELITTRIKILSRLRTDEHAAAQDGKLRARIGDMKIDIRVSIVPVISGEKTVMRILSEKARQFDLQNLGFAPHDIEKIERNMRRPWGMILSTGPTGCGKTTTLYGILKILNRREVNISTIEDPVEYAMENINQIQVNPKTNLTFSNGLRSIVRQDPDIIMVGEIRDEETADIAINSALTGHLVLSTLHTNDSATTLPRLIDMKVEPFLVASTINIAIAQRLVRKNCDQCKEERAVDSVVLEAIKKQLSPELIKKFGFDQDGLRLMYGRGCETCQMVGYNGRTVIAEVMEMNDQIRQMVMQENNASQILQKAHTEGMTTMIEDGLDKVKKGLTTLEEILRVAQE